MCRRWENACGKRLPRPRAPARNCSMRRGPGVPVQRAASSSSTCRLDGPDRRARRIRLASPSGPCGLALIFRSALVTRFVVLGSCEAERGSGSASRTPIGWSASAARVDRGEPGPSRPARAGPRVPRTMCFAPASRGSRTEGLHPELPPRACDHATIERTRVGTNRVSRSMFSSRTSTRVGKG